MHHKQPHDEVIRTTRQPTGKKMLIDPIDITVILVILMVLPSCVSHRNLITFNQTEDLEQGLQIDTFVATPDSIAFRPHRLQPYDQVMIRINAFGGDTEAFINQGLEGNTSTNRLDYDPATVYFNSFIISDSGYIELPMVKRVRVSGLTTIEVEQLLNRSYEPYLKLVTTRVKLANNRITVMGEVAEPGVHYLYNERNTLLDAVGLAGDFTEFADRRKVRLLRSTVNGTRSIYFDFTRLDFLTSEYFYLQPNDLIYVQPMPAKSFDVSARSVGIVLSGISLISIIVNLFQKN